MKLAVTVAKPADAAELARLHCAVAEDLTLRFGHGFWSMKTTERGVRSKMRHSLVLVSRKGKRIVGTLNLHNKKPWAIDVSYFTPVEKVVYLTGMAVAPGIQGKGVGRQLLNKALKHARAWPAHAIRLDAFDSAAGAGPFYVRYGFREIGRTIYRKEPLIYFELLL